MRGRMFGFQGAAVCVAAMLSVMPSVTTWGVAEAQQSSVKPLVVVITVDGFPARALEDPRLPMPHLEALMHSGAYAKGMVPINPSVTWPNHTALITGVNAMEHHVMANGLIVFPEGGGAPEVKPWVDKNQLVHAETLYDAAAMQGMTTGQVDWVAIYGAKNVRWSFGEKPDPASPIAQDLVQAGTLTEDEVENFGDASPAWHDEIWTDAAVDILEHHTPNLLLLHLLQTDSIQHKYGAMSSAAYEAFANADDCIGRVMDAVKAIGALDRGTYFILSDHGFTSFTHAISPDALLRSEGLIEGAGKQAKGKVWAQTEGGAAEIFIRDDAHRAALTRKLQQKFAALPGVEHAYTNAEARSLGVPALGTTDQAPDLYLTARPDYSFEGDADAPLESDVQPARGGHGYDTRNPDMQALFVASGAHIKAGVVLPVFPNLQVAPTIARVLGVQLPAAKQPPLDILH